MENQSPSEIPQTENERQKALLKAKVEYKTARLPMSVFLSEMKTNSTFILPGKVASAKGFQKESANTVTLQWEGNQLFSAMDGLMQNEEWLRSMIRKGIKPLQANPAEMPHLSKTLFGADAPPRVKIKVAEKPLFDYEKEVQAALPSFKTVKAKVKQKANQTTAQEQEEEEEIKPALQGEGFQSVEVVGKQIVEKSEDRLRPFHREAGLTLAVMAKLAGSVLSFDRGMVDRAITDTGDSLLEGMREWDRTIRSIQLNKEKDTALFEVKMNTPPEQAQAIKVISGSLEYLTGSDKTTADAGITKFQAEEEGDLFDIKITKVGDRLEFSLNTDINRVDKIAFFDAEGKEIDIPHTIKYAEGGTRFGRGEDKVPAEGKIQITYYKEFKRYTIPFEIEDYPLEY